MKSQLHLLFLCLAVVSVLPGCMGAPDSSSSAGVAHDALSVLPEHELPASVLDSTPAGCEGALQAGAFEILGLAGEPDLRVVRNGDRNVCVDSLESLREEVLSLDEEQVSVWINAARVTVGEPRLFTHREEVSGDPSPQPNRPGWFAPSNSAAQGDPSPQPNSPTRPDASDPSPQPNQPHNGAPTSAIQGLLAQLLHTAP